MDSYMQSKVNQMSQKYYKAVCEQQVKNNNRHQQEGRAVINQKHADEIFKRSIEARSVASPLHPRADAMNPEDKEWNHNFHKTEDQDNSETYTKKKMRDLGNSYIYSRQSIKKPNTLNNTSNTSMITPSKSAAYVKRDSFDYS